MKAEIPTKRIYLVNRDFQFRYTRVGVLAGLVSTIMTSIVILYPLFVFKILVIPQFLPAPILAGMLVALLINVGMIVMFGILITHRIAGPMFSMVRHMRRIANGSWKTSMRIRPGDELQLLVRNLNDVSDALVQSATEDIALIDRILETSTQSPETTKFIRDLRARMVNRIQNIDELPPGGPVP